MIPEHRQSVWSRPGVQYLPSVFFTQRKYNRVLKMNSLEGVVESALSKYRASSNGQAFDAYIHAGLHVCFKTDQSISRK